MLTHGRARIRHCEQIEHRGPFRLYQKAARTLDTVAVRTPLDVPDEKGVNLHLVNLQESCTPVDRKCRE